MNKIFLTSAFIPLFIANISPVLAESKLTTNRLPEQKLNYSQKTETLLIAGFGDFIEDAKKVVEDGTGAVRDVNDTVNDIKERDLQQKERKQALEERKRRQEEYEAARKAATEKQRQEAERRRQYWESLSPEEKQAYIQRQRELQQKQAEVAAGLFLMFLGAGDGGSSGGQTGEYVVYPDNNSAPTYNPAPAPTKPIDPFYGDCHSPMGC